MTNPIVYIIPHQDDEVLTFGAAIKEDVAIGREVICYLASNGDASGVRTGAALSNRIGYTPTKIEFSEARDREFIACCEILGATPIVRRYHEREYDSIVSVSGVIHDMKVTFPPGLDIASCATFDYGNDHNNTGYALQELVRTGWARSGRYYLAHNRQYLNQTGVPMIRRGINTQVTLEDQAPYRLVDLAEGMWGIGYLSVASSFDSQINTDGASYYHNAETRIPVYKDANGNVINLVG